MHFALILLLGLATGILVGLMGIGGGIIIIPALVYLLGMHQHMAQGTSLFILLPPLGLGALWIYWKRGQVNLPAGAACAAGVLIGGYGGGLIAIEIPSRALHALFGLFLICSAVLLWMQTQKTDGTDGDRA